MENLHITNTRISKEAAVPYLLKKLPSRRYSAVKRRNEHRASTARNVIANEGLAAPLSLIQSRKQDGAATERNRRRLTRIRRASAVELAPLHPKVEAALRHLEESMRHQFSTLLAEFRNIDKDNSGSISTWELELMMSQQGFKLTTAEWDEVFGQLDSDSDGEIDYRELKNSLTAWRQRHELDSNLFEAKTDQAGFRLAYLPPAPLKNVQLAVDKDQEAFSKWLDTFIAAELRRHCEGINSPEEDPHQHRLQVYMEAFRRFIDSSTVSKPLLAAIKQEYERYITFVRRRLDNRHLVAAQLDTAEAQIRVLVGQHEVDRKRMMQRVSDIDSGEDVKQLRRKIDDISLEIQLLKKQISEACTERDMLNKLQETMSNRHSQMINETKTKKLERQDIEDKLHLKRNKLAQFKVISMDMILPDEHEEVINSRQDQITQRNNEIKVLHKKVHDLDRRAKVHAQGMAINTVKTVFAVQFAGKRKAMLVQWHHNMVCAKQEAQFQLIQQEKDVWAEARATRKATRRKGPGKRRGSTVDIPVAGRKGSVDPTQSRRDSATSQTRSRRDSTESTSSSLKSSKPPRRDSTGPGS